MMYAKNREVQYLYITNAARTFRIEVLSGAMRRNPNSGGAMSVAPGADVRLAAHLAPEVP